MCDVGKGACVIGSIRRRGRARRAIRDAFTTDRMDQCMPTGCRMVLIEECSDEERGLQKKNVRGREVFAFGEPSLGNPFRFAEAERDRFEREERGAGGGRVRLIEMGNECLWRELARAVLMRSRLSSMRGVGRIFVTCGMGNRGLGRGGVEAGERAEGCLKHEECHHHRDLP